VVAEAGGGDEHVLADGSAGKDLFPSWNTLAFDLGANDKHQWRATGSVAFEFKAFGRRFGMASLKNITPDFSKCTASVSLHYLYAPRRQFAVVWNPGSAPENKLQLFRVWSRVRQFRGD
tara:strand:- start:144 stop:500 length:357 start_codon:yes stop_codon:yes gene_type:complete